MMSYQEIVQFIRTNKVKCSIYISIGAVMIFLICSVFYLLMTVKIDALFQSVQPDSIRDPIIKDDTLHTTKIITSNLTANMIALLAKFVDYKKEVAKNISLLQLDYTKYKKDSTVLQLDYKNAFINYKKDLTKNLTLIQLGYNKKFINHKKESTKNFTSMFSDNKKELTGLIKNLTNSLVSLRLAHLETKAKIMKNLTYILLRNNNLSRYCEVNVGNLNMLAKINNNTIHKVLSQSLDYMERHKNILRQNITKILQIMEKKEANIVKKGILFDKKIDSALEGSQLFWGDKCPGSWKDIGGVYPVKVCNYTGTS